MRKIVLNMRINPDNKDMQIKMSSLEVAVFENNELIDVLYEISIWDNTPKDLMEMYRGNCESTKDFIENHLKEIIDGFCIESTPGYSDIEDHLEYRIN